MSIPVAERLADADAAVRRLAVMDLPYGDEDDIVPLLLPMLADADAGVRTEAVRALEGLEEPEVVRALAQCLLDADAGVRKAAGEVLGELKLAPSADAMLPMLDEHQIGRAHV